MAHRVRIKHCSRLWPCLPPPPPAPGPIDATAGDTHCLKKQVHQPALLPAINTGSASALQRVLYQQATTLVLQGSALGGNVVMHPARCCYSRWRACAHAFARCMASSRPPAHAAAPQQPDGWLAAARHVAAYYCAAAGSHMVTGSATVADSTWPWRFSTRLRHWNSARVGHGVGAGKCNDVTAVALLHAHAV